MLADRPIMPFAGALGAYISPRPLVCSARFFAHLSEPSNSHSEERITAVAGKLFKISIIQLFPFLSRLVGQVISILIR